MRELLKWIVLNILILHRDLSKIPMDRFVILSKILIISHKNVNNYTDTIFRIHIEQLLPSYRMRLPLLDHYHFARSKLQLTCSLGTVNYGNWEQFFIVQSWIYLSGLLPTLLLIICIISSSIFGEVFISAIYRNLPHVMPDTIIAVGNHTSILLSLFTFEKKWIYSMPLEIL